MKQTWSLRLAILTLCVSVVFLFSCEEREGLDVIPISGDYFPVEVGAQWEYKEQYKCYYPDTASVCTWPEPQLIQVEKDTIVDGLSYKKMSDYGGNYKLIRRAGTKYYYRELSFYYGPIESSGTDTQYGYLPMLSEEMLFLDTHKAVGQSWTQTFKSSWGNNHKVRHVIKAIEPEIVIGGHLYKDVMEVEEVISYTDEEGEIIVTHGNRHVYARGVGEVYTFYPYPPKYMTDVELTLLKYSR